MRWKQRPVGVNWRSFGPGDQIGRLNILSPEVCLAAVRAIRAKKGVAAICSDRVAIKRFDAGVGRCDGYSFLSLHQLPLFKLVFCLGRIRRLHNPPERLKCNGIKSFHLFFNYIRILGDVVCPVTSIAIV